jgi:hypothetical protein
MEGDSSGFDGRQRLWVEARLRGKERGLVHVGTAMRVDPDFGFLVKVESGDVHI